MQAIVGTNVVTFGLNMAQTEVAGLLGIALERSDDDVVSYRWLQALKTFKATGHGIKPGELVATNEHPVQIFLWSDFTVRPGRNTAIASTRCGATRPR